jgi:AraC family transcriptional regulator
VSRTFGAVHGRTLGQYVRELRLEAAQAELAQGARPLAEVALRAGFSDQSHLTRALKRATGLTPARYRSLARGGERDPASGPGDD